MSEMNVIVRGIVPHGVNLDYLRSLLGVLDGTACTSGVAAPVVPIEITRFLHRADVPQIVKSAFMNSLVPQNTADGEAPEADAQRAAAPLNGFVVLRLIQELREHPQQLHRTIFKPSLIAAELMGDVQDKNLSIRDVEAQLVIGAIESELFVNINRKRIAPSLISRNPGQGTTDPAVTWFFAALGDDKIAYESKSHWLTSYIEKAREDGSIESILRSLNIQFQISAVSSQEVELGVGERYVQELAQVRSGSGCHLGMVKDGRDSDNYIAQSCVDPDSSASAIAQAQSSVLTPFCLSDIRKHIVLPPDLLAGNLDAARGNRPNSGRGYYATKGYVFVSKVIIVNTIDDIICDGCATSRNYSSGSLSAWGYLTPTDFQPILGNIYEGISFRVSDPALAYRDVPSEGSPRTELSGLGIVNTPERNNNTYANSGTHTRNVCTGNANTLRSREVLESEVEHWNNDLGTSVRHTLSVSSGHTGIFKGAFTAISSVEHIGGQAESSISQFLAYAFKYSGSGIDSSIPAPAINNTGWYDEYLKELDYNGLSYVGDGSKERVLDMAMSLYTKFPISRIRQAVTGHRVVRTRVAVAESGPRGRCDIHDLDSWWAIRTTGPSNNTVGLSVNGGRGAPSLESILEIPVSAPMREMVTSVENVFGLKNPHRFRDNSTDTALHMLFSDIVREIADEELFLDAGDVSELSHYQKTLLVEFAYFSLIRYMSHDLFARTMRANEQVSINPPSAESFDAIYTSRSVAVGARGLPFIAHLPLELSRSLAAFSGGSHRRNTISLFRDANKGANEDVIGLNIDLRKEGELPFYTNGLDKIITAMNPQIGDQVMSKMEDDGAGGLLLLITNVLEHATPVRLEKAVSNSSAQIFL